MSLPNIGTGPRREKSESGAVPIRSRPPSPFVTLREALNWVAHNDFVGPDTSWLEFQVASEDVDPEVLHFTHVAIQDREEEAKADLISGLRDNSVTAHGREVDSRGSVVPEASVIPAGFWNDAEVLWDRNVARGPSKSFAAIQLDRARVLEVWRPETSPDGAEPATTDGTAARGKRDPAAAGDSDVGPPIVTLQETVNWIACKAFEGPDFSRQECDAKNGNREPLNNAQRNHAGLVRDARVRLLRALRLDAIQAYGSNPIFELGPQAISSEFWIWAAIDWDRSRAKRQPIEYHDVTLSRDDVLALWSRDLPTKKPVDSVNRRKRGADRKHEYGEIDQQLENLLRSSGAGAFRSIAGVMRYLKQQLGETLGLARPIPESTLRSHIKEWKNRSSL